MLFIERLALYAVFFNRVSAVLVHRYKCGREKIYLLFQKHLRIRKLQLQLPYRVRWYLPWCLFIKGFTFGEGLSIAKKLRMV